MAGDIGDSLLNNPKDSRLHLGRQLVFQPGSPELHLNASRLQVFFDLAVQGQAQAQVIQNFWAEIEDEATQVMQALDGDIPHVGQLLLTGSQVCGKAVLDGGCGHDNRRQ